MKKNIILLAILGTSLLNIWTLFQPLQAAPDPNDDQLHIICANEQFDWWYTLEGDEESIKLLTPSIYGNDTLIELGNTFAHYRYRPEGFIGVDTVTFKYHDFGVEDTFQIVISTIPNCEVENCETVDVLETQWMHYNFEYLPLCAVYEIVEFSFHNEMLYQFIPDTAECTASTTVFYQSCEGDNIASHHIDGDWIYESIIDSAALGNVIWTAPPFDCVFDNPLEDLEWFQAWNWDGVNKIIEYTYLGETLFFIERCESSPSGDDDDYILMTCQGNTLCFSSLIELSCEPYFSDLVYVQTWQEGEESLDCVEYDCNNIPFGPDDCEEECNLDLLFENNTLFEWYRIIEYDYLGESILFVEACESAGDSPDYYFYDCMGNELCEHVIYDEESCYEFLPDLVYIQTWQEGENLSCVEYDCNNIPFGDFECNKDQDVWAGDVNYDGVCNNLDIMYMGFKFTAEGEPRPNASILWEAQEMEDWNDWQTIGENTKHADCNGDGVVNLTDKEAIDSNYNLSHEVGKNSSEGLPIYIELPDTVTAGDTIEIPIYLGSEQAMLQDFYAIAFSIEFKSEYVKEGSINIDYSTTFLGDEDINVMGLDKTFHPEGVVEIGLSKIDQQSVNGHGPIAKMSLVMIDDIIGKDLLQVPFTLNITNITALTQLAEDIPIADTIVQSEIQTGIQPINPSITSIYPNPAKDKLIIKSNELIQNISLFNLQGQKLMSVEGINANEKTLSLNHLKNGMYFLQIETENRVNIQKVQILK